MLPKVEFEDKVIAPKTIRADEVLELVNVGMNEARHKIWIALDRLDVAFDSNQVLEENAIRALFKTYNDLKTYENIRIKIFIRTDIWQRITRKGFREATHITREVTIDWGYDSLLNMLIRRAAAKPAFNDVMGINKDVLLADLNKQYELFYRIYPRQIDVGTNKPDAFKWIIGHTRDGSGRTAPRDVIHLLNLSVEKELKRLELGDDEENDCVITRSSVKEALAMVSHQKVSKYLYAEYSYLIPYFDKLKGSKTNQTIKSLSDIWKESEESIVDIANECVRIGLFEKKKESDSYWVPFIFRDGLELTQGTAESGDG